MATWFEHCDDYIAWENGVNIDADGSPRAYSPNGGLDYLANAKDSHGNWVGVAVDSAGNPFIQGYNGIGPCTGAYISTTSLQDHSKDVMDAARYVDSEKVPYISIPRNAIKDYGASVGDVGFCFCRSTGKFCAGIVVDTGPKNKWGEVSIAMANALGINASAKNGGTSSGVVVVVFLNTHKGWPRTNEEVAQHVQDRLNELGGTDFYQDILSSKSA